MVHEVPDVQVDVRYSALGEREAVTFTWPDGARRAWLRGGALHLAYGRDFPREGEVFDVGPYRVRVVSADLLWLAVVVVRDGPLWWSWLLGSRAARLADLAYRRLIITAAVWGLASYQHGRLPSWRDLYLVQWLLTKVRG